jgi:hypothetical protein
VHGVDGGIERLLPRFGGGREIILRRGGAGKQAGGFKHLLAERIGHDEPHHFPLGNLVAEGVVHSAGQLDFENVGLIALHQRGSADENWARIVDSPRHEDAARVVLVPLDDELVAAEVCAAEPRQVVRPTHVNVFEPVRRDALAIVDD